MNQEKLALVLNDIVPLGLQGMMDNIPLPQVQIEKTDNLTDILVYSSKDDLKYHNKLVSKIKKRLDSRSLSVHVVRHGPSYPIDQPKSCFWGSRLRLIIKDTVKEFSFNKVSLI